VIDVQLGMFESPLIPPVHNADKLLSVISSAIAHAREAGVQVIYIQHCGGKGHPLQEGTPQWQIHPAIRPSSGDPIVKKRFPDSFQETELQELPQSSSIGRLFVVGIQTDFCVDTTCRRAFSLGYDVGLVEDGHSTWDNEVLTAAQIIAHHNRTLGSSFVKLVRADALLNDLQVAAKTKGRP
jgi:nicotinamidase-related amidase